LTNDYGQCCDGLLDLISVALLHEAEDGLLGSTDGLECERA
jgi:hypothetical protein